MREIKLKAWDKRQKQMSGIFTIADVTQYEYIFERMFNKLARFKDLIWLEYTGLKDKNGKEGYFDDLVKWGKAIYKVVWNEKEGIAALQYVSGQEVFKYLRISQIKQGEIIGNVYENPELLS